MMTKYGVVTTGSVSDYDNTKKAEYYDADGFSIADKKNVDKLKKPRKITETPKQDN